jgi:hypothetical protein
MTNDSPADVASLRRQLAEKEENLRLIEERQSQFVMGVDVPLQLEKRERALRKEIAALKAQLAGAEAEPAAQSSAAWMRAMIERLDTLLTGQEGLRRGQAAIYAHVGEANREALEAVLEAVQQDRLEQGEMRRTLEAVRRALIALQGRELPALQADLRRGMDELPAVINSDLTLKNKLELTLPIIPLLLDYKVELEAAAGLDLRQIWENLRHKARQRRANAPALKPPREPSPNPFTDVVAIRDLDRFVGREATLERLLRLLEGGSVAIVGARKIGKTSLLHRLADLLRGEPGQAVVFWDFFDPGNVERLLAQATRALGSDGKKWDDFKRAVRGRRVVLLLDEFDLAPERGFDLDTLRGFRALCQAERGLRCATASRVLPKEVFPTQVGSWPYDFLSPQLLGSFTPDEARRLLAHPWMPDAPRFDAPTGEDLIALSGCHPYRLQRAAHHRYEILHDPAYDWRAAYDLDLEALQ